MVPRSHWPRSVTARRPRPSGSIRRPEKPPKWRSVDDKTRPPRKVRAPNCRRSRSRTAKPSSGRASTSTGRSGSGGGASGCARAAQPASVSAARMEPSHRIARNLISFEGGAEKPADGCRTGSCSNNETCPLSGSNELRRTRARAPSYQDWASLARHPDGWMRRSARNGYAMGQMIAEWGPPKAAPVANGGIMRGATRFTGRSQVKRR